MSLKCLLRDSEFYCVHALIPLVLSADRPYWIGVSLDVRVAWHTAYGIRFSFVHGL